MAELTAAVSALLWVVLTGNLLVDTKAVATVEPKENLKVLSQAVKKGL